MVVFVGDKPSPRMKRGAPAFQGAACETRLKEWIKEVLPNNCGYALVNQSDYDKFLSYLWWAYEDDSPVVALGEMASRALRNENVKHFKLPHPSGRNRQLNDKEFVRKKLLECKEWLKSRKR